MPARRPLTLARAALLGAALLLAQWLGHAHAVAHAAGTSGAPWQAEHRHAHDHAHAHAHTAEGHGHLEAMADAIGGDHAAGDAACRLVDQLTHADLLWAAPAAASLLTAPADAAPQPEAPCRGQAPGAAYQPRAPPALG